MVLINCVINSTSWLKPQLPQLKASTDAFVHIKLIKSCTCYRFVSWALNKSSIPAALFALGVIFHYHSPFSLKLCSQGSNSVYCGCNKWSFEQLGPFCYLEWFLKDYPLTSDNKTFHPHISCRQCSRTWEMALRATQWDRSIWITYTNFYLIQVYANLMSFTSFLSVWPSESCLSYVNSSKYIKLLSYNLIIRFCVSKISITNTF